MMVDESTLTKYLPTIGIECHVQLKTASKLFAAVSNDARDFKPNSTISPICFGLPGVLPVLNAKALELAIRAGHALNAKVSNYSVFDRKHYFYPDLPKGYQISQFHYPIISKGFVEVPTKEGYVKVGITRAHLEEDAGKLTHNENTDYSLVDLNRAGTPLLEIVSEPDIHSSEVAKAYVQEIYNLMRYAKVTEGDLFQGNMRFDVNISVAKKAKKQLGTRSEVKNLNSFKSVQKSINYEIKRQVELLEVGEIVLQETRGWDEAKQKSYLQRFKEEAHDYRYFPDPDIPPLLLSDEEIKAQIRQLPTMPKKRRDEFSKLELDFSQIESLIYNQDLGGLLIDVLAAAPQYGRKVANLLTDAVAAENSKATGGAATNLDSKHLIELAQMLEAGKLNSNAADKVVVIMMNSLESPAEIAKSHNLEQLSDRNSLEIVVDKVIKENPQAVSDFKAGEFKAKGFLIGRVMQATNGVANPKVVAKLIEDALI
jgi:aspartyl-tRNA(Asn)/glutamyl-tRNA(Gln) amidotransferase subunit B